MVVKGIIVGAGIGGLSAAIALSRVGVEVEVFEKAAELKELGAGIVLYPNALAALKKIGAFDAVARSGSCGRHGQYMNSKGKMLAKLDLESAGLHRDSIAIHRADLQNALASTFGVDRIRTGASCIDVFSGDTVSGILLEDGTRVNADFVVGADGIHSVVRAKSLCDGAPRYAGCFAWRGVAPLVPRELAADGAVVMFGCGLQFGGIPLSNERTYWFGAVSDPVGNQGRKSKQDVLKLFGDWASPVRELIEATPDHELLTHDLFDREPSDVWGMGRITLLGDAAHPMTPFMGQGGCQALEDSIALAAAVKRETNIKQALRDYEEMRKSRTANFVLQSRKSQAMSMTSNPIACALRDLVLQLLPNKVLIKQLHTLSQYELPNLD